MGNVFRNKAISLSLKDIFFLTALTELWGWKNKPAAKFSNPPKEGKLATLFWLDLATCCEKDKKVYAQPLLKSNLEPNLNLPSHNWQRWWTCTCKFARISRWFTLTCCLHFKEQVRQGQQEHFKTFFCSNRINWFSFYISYTNSFVL